MSQLIEQLRVRGSRIEVVPGAALRRYMGAEIFFEYPGLDVSELPSHVAVLPFLWAAAPIVWATGQAARVDALEPTVIGSLSAVRDVLRRTYPSLPWSGEVTAGSHAPKDDPRDDRLRSGRRFREAMLFSGGLDSTYSALRHSSPELLLVAVWGIDIPLGIAERWRAFMETAEEFAGRHTGGLQVVRSNVREAFDYRRLNGIAPDLSRWWVDVQFGTTLTAIAAPVAAVHGIETVHLASGIKWPDDQLLRNGSSPMADNAMDFGMARVHHDGNDATRQEKLNWIVASGHTPYLRVCHGRLQGAQTNCGRCVKCVRTIAGIAVAGGDPRRYGFPTYDAMTLGRIQAGFARHEFAFGWADPDYWEDLRDNRPAGAVTDESFIAWLDAYDFRAYYEEGDRAARSRAFVRRARAAAPWLAPVVAPLRRMRTLRKLLP